MDAKADVNIKDNEGILVVERCKASSSGTASGTKIQAGRTVLSIARQRERQASMTSVGSHAEIRL